MCNCMEEKKRGLALALNIAANTLITPAEVISGRAYLTFYRTNGHGKAKEERMLLSRCPFCGKLYEEEKESE